MGIGSRHTLSLSLLLAAAMVSVASVGSGCEASGQVATEDKGVQAPPRSGDGGGAAAPPAAAPRRPDPDGGPAKTAPDASDSPPVVDGNSAWVFDGYCGNDVLGSCDGLADCKGEADTIMAQACGGALERCALPANRAGIKKTFLCAEKRKPIWIFNGYCDLDPGSACAPSDTKPACADPAPDGKDCSATQTKCVNGAKIFVCVDGGKNVWLTSGQCGTNIPGETSCAESAEPICKSNYGGKGCDPAEATRCQTTADEGDSGKVFSCVAR